MLLSSALSHFLLSLEAGGLSPRTIESYKHRLSFLLEFLKSSGIELLGNVSPEALDAWVVSMRRRNVRYDDHPTRPAAKGGLSETTIGGRVQSAKTWLSWCVERGYLDRSPARHLRRPKPQQNGVKVMDRDDLEEMLALAESKAEDGDTRDLALLAFLAETGCRVGELVSLRISNLDLGRLEAVVRGKTGWDTVFFGPMAAEALVAWLDDRPEADHDYVFISLSNNPRYYGNPLTEGGVYQVLKRLARSAGIEGVFGPHSIRHLVGQTFTDRANLALAQKKLRHKDIATTGCFYSHQDDERVKRQTINLSLLNGRDKDE